MSYDHDKQCQDNSIVVDTSNGPSRGWAMIVGRVAMMRY